MRINKPIRCLGVTLMGHQILEKKLQGKVQNLGGRIVYLFLGNNSQVLYQYLMRTNLVVPKAIHSRYLLRMSRCEREENTIFRLSTLERGSQWGDGVNG